MDTICVTMPEDLHQFMIAMAVAQDYQLQLAVGVQRKEREHSYQFTFRLKEEFRFFENSIRVIKDNMPVFDYSGWNEKQRGEYDCFIDFDFERAKVISKNVGLHITGGFNAIVGSGSGHWPIMKYIMPDIQVDDPSMVVDVLIIPWDEEEGQKFYGYLKRSHPDLEILIDNRDFKMFEDKPRDLLAYINHFKVVVGRMSAATYAAACLKKAVIEIFPTSDDVLFYTNYGLDYYGYCVENNKVTANTVWSIWGDLWHDLSSDTNSQEQHRLMASQVSIADNVDEKSLEQSDHKSVQ